MQRDLGLLRQILLEVEAVGLVEALPAPGAADQAATLYHVGLAIQAGFLSAEGLEPLTGEDGAERPAWRSVALTWKGGDALDLIRDEGAFVSGCAHVRERLGGVPFADLLGHLRQQAGLR